MSTGQTTLAIHSSLINLPLLFLETGRKRPMHTVLKITNSTTETELPVSILGLPLAIYDVGIESLWGREFPHPSRPDLGHIQPPIEWVLGRGGFTVKLMKLKLLGPSLGTGLFQGPGTALNNYLLSNLILSS
jgi:hypothetical protein